MEDFDGNATPGIEITISTTIIDGSDIVVNYWDFGGQEIQHSMHRMFLTERTLYVVFLNARQDPLDERAFYWLENIRSYTSDAPVLLVINKIDQNDKPKFNESGITNIYRNQIKKIIRMSALNDAPDLFLSELQDSINDVIREMDSVNRKIPKSWKLLMENIRGMSDHYLTTKQFMSRCVSCEVNNYKEVHDDLVDLFQVVGVSFCYYKNRAIADYMILNPKWLVNALYTIIVNSEVASKNGVITQDDLYNLLKEDTLHDIVIKRVRPDLRYEGIEVNYILGVMRMFRLSYSLKDGAEFFPMLCDGDEKVKKSEVIHSDALHFIFRYSYLPANVMHRLIVEMQHDLDYQYVWFTGAVFRDKELDMVAYVNSISNNLHIYTESRDTFYNPNEYLTPILNIVRRINREMNLLAEELITYSEDGKEAYLYYEDVKGSLKNGIDKIYDRNLNGVIDLRKTIRRFVDQRPKISGGFLSKVLQALRQMQNDRTYYRNDANAKSLEDARNRFVSAQLRICGYNCSDQQTGGVSLSGKNAGERDIVFRDKKERDFLIYEGLNLRNIDTTSIETHIGKLMSNYNPQGLPYGIMVTYLECKREDYMDFISKYRDIIIQYSPESYKCIGEPNTIPTLGHHLTCIEMNYECGESYYAIYTIYHIVVRVAE